MTWIGAVYAAANWLYFSAGLLAAGAAASLLAPRLRSRLSAAAADPRRAWLPLAVLGLAFPAFFVLLKLAALHAFLLTGDTGRMVHMAWKAAHGWGLHSSDLCGRSYLAVHFAFACALFAPLIRLWPSAAVLAAGQGAAVASSVYAIYLLAEKRTASPASAWLLAFAAASCPLFQDLSSTYIDNGVFALPLFLWGAYFWESGRRWTAAGLGLLLLTTKEEAPFIFLGVGAYLCLRSERRRLALGAGLAAASILAWLAELRVINAYREGLDCFNYWRFFDALGGTAAGVRDSALHRPWLFLTALAVPPVKLLTVLRVLASLAFAPLAAGWAILPALAAWAPHQLSDPSGQYHRLLGHYSSFVCGPLLWASVLGFQALKEKLSPRDFKAFVLLLLTMAAAANFRFAGFYRERLMPASWREAVPRMLSLIPEDSKLWCESYLLPDLALRPYVKGVPLNLPYCYFEEGLFLPDHVLLSTYALRVSDPATRERLTEFLRRNRYELIRQEQDLVLLRHPDWRAILKDPPRFIRLP